MNRRNFLTSGVTAASVLAAGCLASGQEGRTVSDNPSFPADAHERHMDELTDEIERRGVSVLGVERREEHVVVDYEAESFDNDLAAVAMAFVERIDGGWGIDRLEAIARDDATRSWHAKAEWASDYLAGNIDADEYGNHISDTLQQSIVLEDDE
jgi:hypothetical protein